MANYLVLLKTSSDLAWVPAAQRWQTLADAIEAAEQHLGRAGVNAVAVYEQDDPMRHMLYLNYQEGPRCVAGSAFSVAQKVRRD